ncbi:hypothetical protein D3C78_1388620 [compost metagenome]
MAHRDGVGAVGKRIIAQRHTVVGSCPSYIAQCHAVLTLGTCLVAQRDTVGAIGPGLIAQRHALLTLGMRGITHGNGCLRGSLGTRPNGNPTIAIHQCVFANSYRIVTEGGGTGTSGERAVTSGRRLVTGGKGIDVRRCSGLADGNGIIRRSFCIGADGNGVRTGCRCGIAAGVDLEVLGSICNGGIQLIQVDRVGP